MDRGLRIYKICSERHPRNRLGNLDEYCVDIKRLCAVWDLGNESGIYFTSCEKHID